MICKYQILALDRGSQDLIINKKLDFLQKKTFFEMNACQFEILYLHSNVDESKLVESFVN